MKVTDKRQLVIDEMFPIVAVKINNEYNDSSTVLVCYRIQTLSYNKALCDSYCMTCYVITTSFTTFKPH